MALLFGLDSLNNEEDKKVKEPAHFITNLANRITDKIYSNQPKAAPAPTPAYDPARLGTTQIATPGYKPPPSLTGSEIKAAPPDAYAERFTKPVGELPWYMRPGRVAVDTIKGAVTDLSQRGLDLTNSLFGLSGKMTPQGTMETSSLTTNEQRVDRVTKMFSLGLGAINTALLPVTATFAAGEQLPVAGDVFKGINKAFQGAAEVAQPTADLVVDKMPVSDKTKESLRPVVTEMFSLLAQFGLGKIAHDTVLPRLNEKEAAIKKLIDEETRRKIPVKSDAMETAIEVKKPPIEKTPAEKHAEYAQSQGYEPYAAPETLPTIDYGRSAPSTLPVIEAGASAPRTGSYTYDYEPVRDVIEAYKRGQESVQRPVVSTPSKPAVISETPALPEAAQTKVATAERPTTQGMRVAKSASDINQTYAEKGFGKIPQEEQAKYSPTTKAEQVKKVSGIMSDIEEARSMIRGEKPVPSDVLPQVLFNAVEEYATKNGDARMLRELANSPIARQLSEAAQALGSHGYNDNPNSAVNAIREVMKAREEKAQRKTKDIPKETKKIAKEIDAEIKKTSKKKDWALFVKELQCK